jgi:ribosomal-protein-alanine N-acetyltransferase
LVRVSHGGSFSGQYSGARGETFYTLAYQQAAIEEGLSSPEKGDEYFFGVFVPGTHQLVGTVSLFEVMRDPFHAAWIGYAVDHARNGRG